MTFQELDYNLDQIMENVENCQADVLSIADNNIQDHLTMADYLAKNLNQIEDKVKLIKYEIQKKNLRP